MYSPPYICKEQGHRTAETSENYQRDEHVTANRQQQRLAVVGLRTLESSVRRAWIFFAPTVSAQCMSPPRKGGKPMPMTAATSRSPALATIPSSSTRQPSFTTGKNTASMISASENPTDDGSCKDG